jgi:CheY-like chemotaxis protein
MLPQPTVNQSGSLYLLLVEDELIVQKVHRRLLEMSGHRVDLAINAEDAITMSETSTYDAILMDIGLPKMNGIDATREIRRREITTNKHTPIIGLSCFAVDDVQAECLTAGMDEFATKPISQDNLNMLLKKLTTANSANDPHVIGS